jgi:hypothetical protein
MPWLSKKEDKWVKHRTEEMLVVLDKGVSHQTVAQ